MGSEIMAWNHSRNYGEISHGPMAGSWRLKGLRDGF
jgi:hypothetical protein